MPALRVPMALSGGALFALGVFYLLWALVDVPIEIGTLIEPTRVEYTRTKFNSEVETKREEKVKREPPPLLMDPPRIKETTVGVEPVAARVQPRFERTTLNDRHPTPGSDRDAIPLVRVEPDYPLRELERGIEGWVHVQFTIAANGAVKDAFVVAADPPSRFDAAALAAIARWRYQPRIEAGTPVERVGMQTVIRFSIE